MDRYFSKEEIYINVFLKKKLFNTISHQENANKIYHSQNSIFKKKKSKQTTKTRNETSAVKGLGKRTALFTVGVSVNWYEYGLQQTLVHLGSCCFYSQQSGNGTSP